MSDDWDLGRGVTRAQVEERFRRELGREVRPTTLDELVGLGLLEVRDGLFFRTERGAEFTRLRNAYRAAIAGSLHGQYILDDGRPVNGQALSWLVKDLRFERLKMPSHYGAQVDLLRSLGFEVASGRSIPKNTPCQVVYRREAQN